MKYLQVTLIFLMMGCSIIRAQSNTQKLIFYPVFGNSQLTIKDTFYTSGSADTLILGSLKFYISGIEFLKDNDLIWKEANSHHLIDVSDKNSLLVSLQPPAAISYNQIKFNIGIDSSTNVSGAMGGDLDPTKGMYWTWQSGYINFKLEGQYNHIWFQYHTGGYQYPWNTLRTVVLNAGNNNETDIIIDLSKLFSGIDLNTINHIMSPGKNAVILSDKISTIFEVKIK